MISLEKPYNILFFLDSLVFIYRMCHIVLMYRRSFNITLVQWSGSLKIHEASVASGTISNEIANQVVVSEECRRLQALVLQWQPGTYTAGTAGHPGSCTASSIMLYHNLGNVMSCLFDS